MSKLFICCIILLFQCQKGSSQSEDIHYDKYFQTTLGGAYGSFGGELGNHLDNTIALGTSLAAGISRSSSIGFGFQYHFAESNNTFALDPGASYIERPDILNVAVAYNKVLGTASKSHFHTQVGLGYSWLNYQQGGNGMKGINPKLEIGWAQRITSKSGSPDDNSTIYRRGNLRFFDVRSGSGQSSYRPVMVNTFIDFYLSYNYMNLNNPQGKGSLLMLGARYKKLVYSESYTVGEN